MNHDQSQGNGLLPVHFGVGVVATVALALVCVVDALMGWADLDLERLAMFGAATLSLWTGVFAMARRVSLAFLPWIFGALSADYSMIFHSEYANSHDIGWVTIVVCSLVGAMAAHACYVGGRFLFRLVTPVNRG